MYLGPDSIITPAGFSTRETLDAIARGESGCAVVDDPSIFGKPLMAGKIDEDRLEKATGNPGDGWTKLEKLFILTVGEVLSQSGVDPADADTGIVFSSTKGNIDLLAAGEEVRPEVLLYGMARRVSDRFGFRNDPLVICNACISGVSAIIAAARLIREGRFRNVVVAGGDILSRFTATGFSAFKSVSERVCRPYDSARDGLTLGEGCGALLLTRDRERAEEPYVTVAGGGISNDANHISGPSRTGDGLFFAISEAMEEAGVTEIGFINGHGTATVYNDEMESKAFALAGLCDVPLNGLKPWFGHMLGAAGVVESIICAHSLRNGIVYGVPGFENTGTTHELNVSARHRNIAAGNCLKTASGFGGCNAALVLSRRETASGLKEVETDIRQTARCRIEPDGRPFAEMIRERFKALGSPDMKFYKMDDFCKLGYVAAAELLKDAALAEKYAPSEIGIVLANRSGSLDTDIRHCEVMKENGDEVSPAVFVYTLPNVLAGEIAIRHKLQGECTFFIQDPPDNRFTEEYARGLLRRGRLKAVVCGWCDLVGEDFLAEMKLLEI